jgi:hypothetical protein
MPSIRAKLRAESTRHSGYFKQGKLTKSQREWRPSKLALAVFLLGQALFAPDISQFY